MGKQEIALVVIGTVLALIYLASRWLEKDSKRLEELQDAEQKLSFPDENRSRN